MSKRTETNKHAKQEGANARPQRTSDMRVIFGIDLPAASRWRKKGYMSWGVKKRNWR